MTDKKLKANWVAGSWWDVKKNAVSLQTLGRILNFLLAFLYQFGSIGQLLRIFMIKFNFFLTPGVNFWDESGAEEVREGLLGKNDAYDQHFQKTYNKK
jgi:hypothetical protein